MTETSASGGTCKSGEDKFLAALSHELRHRLRNGVRGGVRAGNGASARIREQLGMMRRNGAGSALIDDLLDLARISRDASLARAHRRYYFSCTLNRSSAVTHARKN